MDDIEITKIVFSFDQNSLATLRNLHDLMELTQERELQLSDVMREGLRMLHNLIQQAREGYSRVILENRDSGLQREIIIPVLEKASELRK